VISYPFYFASYVVDTSGYQFFGTCRVFGSVLEFFLSSVVMRNLFCVAEHLLDSLRNTDINAVPDVLAKPVRQSLEIEFCLGAVHLLRNAKS